MGAPAGVRKASAAGGQQAIDIALRAKQTSLRLSFSLLEPEDLEEGVERLGRALRAVRRRDRTTLAAPFS